MSGVYGSLLGMSPLLPASSIVRCCNSITLCEGFSYFRFSVIIVKDLNCCCYNELNSFPVRKAMYTRRHVCVRASGTLDVPSGFRRPSRRFRCLKPFAARGVGGGSFDLWSSSVATRQSRCKHRFALAAPSVGYRSKHTPKARRQSSGSAAHQCYM